MMKKIQTLLKHIFKSKSSERKLNKFEEEKRSRLIKKMRSNAIAILTSQIDLRVGSIKMYKIINKINFIQPLDNIDLDVFPKFYQEFANFPVGSEIDHYSVQFLEKIKDEIGEINVHYQPQILAKCNEIVEQF